MKVEFQYDPKRREVRIISEFLPNIREAFSVSNPAARFSQNPYVPSRFYAITASGYCGIGLVSEIVQYLYNLNIPIEIDTDSLYNDTIKSLRYESNFIKELKCELKLREYQKSAVKIALSNGCGTVVVGTGGGKTFIMASLLNNLDTRMGKVLIVVPDIGLVAQTYNDFISYGIPEHTVTKWTGKNEIDLSKNVIIANLGILQSECSDLSWFKQVTCLFVDECHKLRRGNKVNKLIDKIPTLNRFGFTGTLPENHIDRWNIISQIGPVIYEKTTSDLRDEGQGQYIANARCLALEIEYDQKPPYVSTPKIGHYDVELEFIHHNPFRYRVIKRIVSSLNNNCLILVDRIEHGEKMFDTLSTIENKKVYFIRGDVEVEARQKIQQIMEVQDNIVCIAISKIFSTGISIKNIHYIVFAAGGKSKIKTLQSIGRGLRVHENKDELVIIDIVDRLVYGKKHFEKRKQFYALEKIQISTKRVNEA